MLPSVAGVDYGPEILLVVDDEPSVQRFMQRSLGKLGHKVEVFSCADEALERIRQGGCAIALVDLRMPGHDGVWLLENALQADDDVVVVMVTGESDVHAAIGCLTRGAFHYLVKPVQPAELEQVVRKALETRRLRIENKAYHQKLERLVEERTTKLRATIDELRAAQKALEDAYRDSLYRLAAAAEYRDEEIGAHIRRIGEISRIIAQRLGCEPKFVELLGLASPMHDIGKIGIRDAVLLKPGPLDQEEKQEMQLHTLIGAQILAGSQFPLMQLAEEIARTHHERYDGSGYPYGLAGEDIPLSGRIVAVADVFDALTSDRVYRPALTVEDAVKVLEKDRHLFDPEVLVAFLDALPEIRAVKHRLRDTNRGGRQSWGLPPAEWKR